MRREVAAARAAARRGGVVEADVDVAGGGAVQAGDDQDLVRRHVHDEVVVVRSARGERAVEAEARVQAGGEGGRGRAGVVRLAGVGSGALRLDGRGCEERRREGAEGGAGSKGSHGIPWLVCSWSRPRPAASSLEQPYACIAICISRADSLYGTFCVHGAALEAFSRPSRGGGAAAGSSRAIPNEGEVRSGPHRRSTRASASAAASSAAARAPGSCPSPGTRRRRGAAGC